MSRILRTAHSGVSAIKSHAKVLKRIAADVLKDNLIKEAADTIDGFADAIDQQLLALAAQLPDPGEPDPGEPPEPGEPPGPIVDEFDWDDSPTAPPQVPPPPPRVVRPTPTPVVPGLRVVDPLEPPMPAPGQEPAELHYDGDVALEVEPGKIRVLDTGKVIVSDHFAFPRAVNLMEGYRGRKLVVKGHLLGGEIGGGDGASTSWKGHWSNGQPIGGFEVVAGAGALLEGLSIRHSYGGIDGLVFSGDAQQPFRFCPSPGGRWCIVVQENGRHGLLATYDYEMIGHPKKDPTSEWARVGCGFKWGARCHGHVSRDARRGVYAPASEHSEYDDNVGSETGYPSVFADLKNTGPNGRTGIQLPNRSEKGAPSGRGDVWILRTNFECRADRPSPGGGVYTIAGHIGGRVVIEDATARSTPIPHPKDGKPLNPFSGLVVYSDGGHGLHRNANGFTTDELRVKGLRCDHPQGDRPAVSLSGAEEAVIGFKSLLSGSVCIALWDAYGGYIDNGAFALDLPNPASAYAGWGGKKITRGYRSSQGVRTWRNLSDADIDKLGLQQPQPAP